jgi:hypothetical protein
MNDKITFRLHGDNKRLEDTCPDGFESALMEDGSIIIVLDNGYVCISPGSVLCDIQIKEDEKVKSWSQIAELFDTTIIRTIESFHIYVEEQ